MCSINFTGPPAAPYHLVQHSNTLTTANITWKSTETNVRYTVTSTSLTSPFSGILQKSFVLRHLEVETDYIVSVTATNECGDESQPSENITVRIDMPGTYCMHMYIRAHVYTVLCVDCYILVLASKKISSLHFQILVTLTSVSHYDYKLSKS